MQTILPTDMLFPLQKLPYWPGLCGENIGFCYVSPCLLIWLLQNNRECERCNYRKCYKPRRCDTASMDSLGSLYNGKSKLLFVDLIPMKIIRFLYMCHRSDEHFHFFYFSVCGRQKVMSGLLESQCGNCFHCVKKEYLCQTSQISKW